MNYVFGFKIALLTLLFMVGMPVFSAEPGLSFVKREVIKRDSRGRVEMMEIRADLGRCVAQITYDEGPRIHVLVISRTRLQNLGFLQINDGTESGLSDATLMAKFNYAIREYCLPLIIKGYVVI